MKGNHSFLSASQGSNAALVFALLWSLAHPVCAQIAGLGFPPLRNFSKEEYGAGTQNWGLTQTSRGLYYAANNKGLLEFDGEAWSLYPLANRTIVHSLAADPSGRIYVGGQAEFGYFEPDARGRMAYTSLSGRVPDAYQTFEDVWHVFLAEAGVLFSTSEALFWLPSAKAAEAAVYPARNRFDGFFELGGQLHVWEQGVGLQVWSPEGLSLVPQGESFAHIPVSGLLGAEGGRLVVTRDQGIFLLAGGRLRPWASSASVLLKEAGIFSALRLSDGRYALGSVRQGLILLDTEGNLLFRLDQLGGLFNNTILCLHEDRNGNLWMGMDNGLACLEMRSPFSYIDERAGVFGSGYGAAVLGGQLLLGTNQGIFAGPWGISGRKLDRESFRIVPGSQGQVWSFRAEADYLWVGHHRGAFRLQGSEYVRLSQADGFWNLWMLAGDSSRALAGAYNGLHLFRRDGSGLWQYDRPLKGFDESSRVLAQDEEGYVWISHAYKGIYRVRISADSDSIGDIRYFHTLDGLPADYGVNVARVRGDLLFTTPAGIYRFDPPTGRFAPDTAFNEALGGQRTVYRLIEDALGDIWFSQEGEFGYLHFRQQGLQQIVEKHLLNPLHSQIIDGFEFVLRLSPDHALIGTEKGFIHCRLAGEKISEPLAFPVFLREIACLTQPGSKLFEGVWSGGAEAEGLHLASQDNNLRFTFAALPDMGSRPCQYRYRLEGLESQWSEWQGEPYKEYTNLPPGDYGFGVEARDAFGQVGAAFLFPFEIHPPWYLSAWARGGYALLMLLCLAGGVWWVYGRMSSTRQKLEQDKAQALREKDAAFEAESRRSEAEIIRLRNEALRAEVAHKNQELASAAMHLVQKGESLQHIKQELRKVSGQTDGELRRQLLQLIHSIDQDLQLDQNWEQFARHFDQVHGAFLQRLKEKYPELTLREQQLSAYLRMNFSTKEIARLMNISVRGAEIGRYRLRKKLGLDADTNLVEFITGL